MALDRTQPGLLMKKGRAGTMTHDYKRHGTTTLFAALDVLEGKVIGRFMQRHRHQEFIRFLNAIEAQVPAKKIVHVILDNYERPVEKKTREQAEAIRRARKLARKKMQREGLLPMRPRVVSLEPPEEAAPRVAPPLIEASEFQVARQGRPEAPPN